MPTAIQEIHYVRPHLYPLQAAAMYGPERTACVEAAPKSGKTYSALCWLNEQAMGIPQGGNIPPGRNYWWAAPVYGQADIAFRRAKAAWRALPLLPAGMSWDHLISEGRMTITLPNGSVIWFKSGENPDNLFGEDVWAAVIDEASRFREESWHALRTTVSATNGPLRLVGNKHGRHNWFWRLCQLAKGNEPGLAYHRLTAADAIAAGIMLADDVADAKRLLPDAVFRELYLVEDADEDQNNPFGLTHIRACTVPALSDGGPVVWGWDLGKSVDWTVGVALDAKRRVCRLLRFQKPWNETQAVIIQETGSLRALVDSTGVGDPVLEHLQLGRSNYEGYKYTATSKQQLMEGLMVAIQQHLLSIPGGILVDEMESFEYEMTRTGVRYAAPDGMHDDCVNALALANHHFKASSQAGPHVALLSRF